MPFKGWKVTGIVQGVGFRYFVARKARGLGLAGHVRNLPDGSVEVCASGPLESLASLEKELALGPPAAAVYSVFAFEPPRGLDEKGGFDIEY